LPTFILWYGKNFLTPLSKPQINVSIIQGSIPDWLYEIERWDEKYSRIVQKTYSKLTEEAVKSGAHIIIWPETTIHRRVMEIPLWKNKIIEFAKAGNTFMVIGSARYDKHNNKFNSIFIISPQGKIIGYYDKTRLVPIAEAHFKAGEDIKIIKTKIANLGINICFESIYPAISRSAVKKGANLLIFQLMIPD
jgi:apolipoprotein N-acyltransferase